MVVERHKRDLREKRKRPQNHTQCHYEGKVRGHENSKVALSACNGLVSSKSSFHKNHSSLINYSISFDC
jgi:hypothetical protein